MTKRIITILIFWLALFNTGYGNEEDTTQIPLVSDSTLPEMLPDDTLNTGDTLSAAQKALASFEERQQLFKQKKEQRLPRLSYFDSLVVYFTSERLNYRTQVERSFFHDAGDYFRSDPSYFILDNQSTPMRKTVQPFGLSGNRLNLIINRLQLNPFEHIVEPDGLTDLNDIPTTLDNDIFIIPGPAGQLFGGRQSVATLLTMPKKPQSLTPESGLIVNKGSFDYAYTRGKYSKLFSNGKEIDFSVGYRNADGIVLNRDDDAYHYTSRVIIPLGWHTGLKLSGQMYDREGAFAIQPDSNGAVLRRSRVDKSAEISFEHYQNNHNIKNEIGYGYLRQNSNIDGLYKGRFNNGGYGFFVGREWMMGSTILKAKIKNDYKDYQDGKDKYERYANSISLSMGRLKTGWRYAFTGGTEYDEDYKWLPFSSAVLFLEKEQFFLMLSAGYSQRAPSLYELNLRFQRADIYSSSSQDYADQGNRQLLTEKQLVGNMLLEIGSVDNNVRLSVTGGKIDDGIEWINQNVIDTAGDYALFSPVNSDIDFVDIQVAQKFKLNDFLRMTSGGAYHYLDYEKFEQKAYQPDYQIFSGIELYVYWPQKLMDLFAYGEIVYNDKYDGYTQLNIDNQLLINAKLSFRIKNFRFHYVFENLLSKSYQSRENFTIPGRYNYFGFNWNFLN